MSDNRIKLFNAPYCIEALGVYERTLAAGQLTFTLFEDDCGSQAPIQSVRKAQAAGLTGFPCTSRWLPRD
jgi:hypothetical protein